MKLIPRLLVLFFAVGLIGSIYFLSNHSNNNLENNDAVVTAGKKTQSEIKFQKSNIVTSIDNSTTSSTLESSDWFAKVKAEIQKEEYNITYNDNYKI